MCKQNLVNLFILDSSYNNTKDLLFNINKNGNSIALKPINPTAVHFRGGDIAYTTTLPIEYRPKNKIEYKNWCKYTHLTIETNGVCKISNYVNDYEEIPKNIIQFIN